MKLLMHVCCAPCSVYCIETLDKKGIKPDLYWYNPNIHPYKEYVSRRDCMIEYAKNINLNLEVNDDYGLEEFCRNVAGDPASRCVKYCYPVRMRKVFEYAKEHGYTHVTTSLLYSIYQKHEFLKKIMSELAEEFGIEFYYEDFRVGFWAGHEKAKDAGMYLQKYCGCIYSENTSDPKNQIKPKLPDNFEFEPVIRSVIVKKEKDNKEQYMDLLFEADPSKELIEKYLNIGDLFVLRYKEEVACLAVVVKVDDNICELKNIVIVEEFRGRGFGKQMIKYLSDTYKVKYDKMIVGTTENNIPFYVKQGFDKYLKTVKNFFVDNYDVELFDGDLKCSDMYYYSKDLKKK